jgi:hypothetical protein
MASAPVLSSPRLGTDLARTARASEWWGYKFAPILGTFYATACVAGVSCWALLPALAVLLLALTTGAVYVSVINDWTDRADDAAAGKANRMAGRPAWVLAAVLAGCAVLGLGFGVFFWRSGLISFLIYLGPWTVYSLYSLPPARLKARGLAGVLADATGAHFFPQLATVALVAHWGGRPLPLAWWLAVGTWGLACGVRNILWHQLGDAAADAHAGVSTLVQRWGRPKTERLGRWVVFPIEAGAFLTLLALSGQAFPWLLLALYAALEAFRWRVWSIRPAALVPHRRIVLNEFYEVLYPLAFLLPQSRRFAADGLVLGLHLLLFGPHIWRSLREVGWAGLAVGRKLLARSRS